MASINRITAGAGNAPGQNNPDFIHKAALFRALGQVFSMGAVSAGALDQISDFKIKFVAFDDHFFLFLIDPINKIIYYHDISEGSMNFPVDAAENTGLPIRFAKQMDKRSLTHGANDLN
jgi:hypothetical protein